MNRLLLLGLLIFLATGNYAQISSPVEVTTKDGQIVILKPNGTWEFKKVVPQPSPIPVTSSVKQNIEIGSLPSNFSGHDLNTLYTQLLDLKKRRSKNEFETTAQYEKRVAEEMQKPILSNLTIKDTFTFVGSLAGVSYNADLQKMTFSLNVSEGMLSYYKRMAGASYTKPDENKVKTTDSDLSAANLYNLRLGSAVFYFNDINGLKLSEGKEDFYSSRKSYTFSAEVSLSVDEAKRISRDARVAILVQLEEPYALAYPTNDAGYPNSDYKNLQVRLIDVYFFDQQTGKILAKMSEVKK